MAGTVQAEAFTADSDIFFRQGAYDTGSDSGRRLIGHEVAHVLQHSGGSIRRMKTPKPPKAQFDVIDEWVKYSSVMGKLRSAKLKAIDSALAEWRSGAKQTPGRVDENITQIEAITKAIADWQASKTGVSLRDDMVQGLRDALTPLHGSSKGKDETRHEPRGPQPGPNGHRTLVLRGLPHPPLTAYA